MIQCTLIGNDGSSIPLPAPTKWNFSYGTGLPCDSFYVRCPWEPGAETAAADAAFFHAHHNSERVFTGAVDEFACVCGRDGLYLELSGRSMAARLLDNEAIPVRYQCATCADIIANHVTPYGIETVGGSALPAVKDFSVSSGVSEWSVVHNFACCHGGIVPRFDRLGRLILEEHSDDPPLEIGSRSHVTGWTFRGQRYGVLSKVGIRQRSSREILWVEDKDFTARGGCARRIVTVPDGTSAMRYTAEYQFRASRTEALRLTLTLAGGFHAWPGQLIRINLPGFGGNGLYRVARSEVACGGTGLSTTLELGEPDSMI